MKFETFSEMEQYYTKQYNYWTDCLDSEGITVMRYQQIEKKVLYYDRKLEALHKNSVTY